MNNEQTRPIAFTIDVEDEKQSVENTTEDTHEEVSETETEVEVETTSDDTETEQSEPVEDKSGHVDSADASGVTAEAEEVTESDTSEELQQTTNFIPNQCLIGNLL